MPPVFDTFAALLFCAWLVSAVYLSIALIRLYGFRRRSADLSRSLPPVTILKPVCGLDSGLFENLSSFCAQDYPSYQVIIGIRNAHDPALAVIKKLLEKFPAADLQLVVDDTVIGTNLKVSNLANMARSAKHPILVIADSDMRVDADYLKTVTAPFQDPRVGAVTCLYKGAAVSGLASKLAAMFINDWFAPSVLVALSTQRLGFCFGATMALPRQVLDAIGGFEVLADQLADDYMLGKRVSERGYQVWLSSYVVENVVLEPGFKTLFAHELRWARTMRSMQPMGFALSFVTHSLPVALLFLLVSQAFALGCMLIAISALLRVLLHYSAHAGLGVRGRATPWLIPLRDMLGFAVWAASFTGRAVSWRDQDFSVEPGGQMTMKGAPHP
ncbi:MAG: bacteriohopanetetrol glucosamine biosynthesis glycosyltransferase HpnI [Burkholderiales bacterium]